MKKYRILALLAVFVSGYVGTVWGQSGGGVDPARKAALDDALRNGLLTQQEYNVKLQALRNTMAGMSKPPVPSRPVSISTKKKTYYVVDTVLNGMPAFKVTVPADWTFDGAVLRSDCGGGTPFLVYRAYSPDNLTGVQMLPQADWYDASDPRAFQMLGVSPCNFHKPARAAEVAAKIATALRSGAKVLGMPPLDATQAQNFKSQSDYGHQRQAQDNSKRAAGWRSTWDVDRQNVLLRYDFEGHPIEGRVVVNLQTWNVPVGVSSTGANGIVQPGVARVIHTTIGVNEMRAPAGQLDATIPILQQIVTAEIIPAWDEAMIAVINQDFATANAALQRSGEMIRQMGEDNQRVIQANNNSYHAWQQQRAQVSREKFAQDMQRKDASSQNFLDYVKDQQYYVNPSTGQTVTIKNEPGVSGYVGLTPSGNWTQLVPISH